MNEYSTHCRLNFVQSSSGWHCKFSFSEVCSTSHRICLFYVTWNTVASTSLSENDVGGACIHAVDVPNEKNDRISVTSLNLRFLNM